MLTRINLFAFVLGTGLLQQQAELPSLQWLWLLLLAVVCYGLWRYFQRSSALLFIQRIVQWSIFLALGFFWAALNAHWRLADTLPLEWEGKDIQVVGVVASLPQRHTNGIRFKFDVEQVLTENAYVPKHIALSWYSQQPANNSSFLPAVEAAQRWQLTIRVRHPHGNANPHGFDYEMWALEHNIRATGYVRLSMSNRLLQPMVYQPQYWIEQVRETIQQRFESHLANKPYSGILKTLATGDQSAVQRDQWEMLIRTGTVHLMAISGLHITLVSGLVFSLLFYLWRSSNYLLLLLRLPARKAAVMGGLLAALGYVALSGFAIPAQRSFWMLFAVAGALWIGRTISPITVLLWALFLVVLWDPWATQSASFWLSFGAIAIILWVTVGRVNMTRGWQQWFRIQWAISLGLVPLLLALFQQVSLVSPLANAIAIPIVSFIVIPLTLLSIIPFLDSILLPLAHGVMSFNMVIMQSFSELPNAVWIQHAPPLWATGVAIAGIFWLLLPGSIGLHLFSGFPARWLGLIALLPLFVIVPSKPADGELWLTVLDVGQGLSVVARTARHSLLFDTGPGFGETDSGSRIIVPYLRGEGVDQLDRMIISHADSDHSGGTLSVIKAVAVDSVFSSLDQSHPLLQQLSHHARCQAGMMWEWDGVHFEVLHPTDETYDNPAGKTNDRSCVLKITSRHGSVLLPSDIGIKEEFALLKHAADKLPANVLIAPHHGSNSSSSMAFIQTVNPELTIFPVGYQNRYHHPHQEILQRYQRYGENMPLLRSDTHGAILMRFANQQYTVESWRMLRKRYWQCKNPQGCF
ncbi:MAG: DNA internalization-related competence protein ComEC/Rec2 [Nitrosomonas sp.]